MVEIVGIIVGKYGTPTIIISSFKKVELPTKMIGRLRCGEGYGRNVFLPSAKNAPVYEFHYSNKEMAKKFNGKEVKIIIDRERSYQSRTLVITDVSI